MPSTLEKISCFSCDSEHENVEVQEFKGQQPSPFTHWFTCPTTKDCVPITVTTFEAQPVAVSKTMVAALMKAQQSKRGYIYLTVVPLPDAPDGRLTVNVDRTADMFPHSHFPEAIRMITDNLNQEIGPPQGTPMVRAVPIPDAQEPLAKLFGPIRGNSDGK